MRKKYSTKPAVQQVYNNDYSESNRKSSESHRKQSDIYIQESDNSSHLPSHRSFENPIPEKVASTTRSFQKVTQRTEIDNIHASLDNDTFTKRNSKLANNSYTQNKN